MESALALERKFISEGYEGLMLNPNIPYYKGKKSNKMLKLKTFETWDCTVLGVYPGESGHKYENTLGGLIVMQENGVEGKVGGGFSDDERDEIWEKSDAVIDRVIEVEYQNLTDDKKMRFPVKKRWRTDKD